MMISFLFSNPGHHAEMLLPVCREIVRRGGRCRLISLAEINGFTTPHVDVAGVEVVRAVPPLRRSPSIGASLDARRGGLRLRKVAHTVAWHAGLRLRLLHLLRGSRLVILPSDTAYPYRHLVHELKRREIPFVLVQEGIRFPLPVERGDGAQYGCAGATTLCCWGAASAEHFTRIGVHADAIRVTGNPRYDAVAPEAWFPHGRALASRLGLDDRPLVFLSNPIDDQGFCSNETKMGLFRSFAEQAASSGKPVLVKLHPREEAASFEREIRMAGVEDHVRVVTDAPLFTVLAAASAAVVLASTVGLDALLFRLPLGVLSIPGYGHVFEYVERGAALGLDASSGLKEGLQQLLHGRALDGGDALLERHLAFRGGATVRLADAIEATAAAGRS